MSSTVLFAINQRLWRLKKPLADAREKVRRLEEDERTLTWMQKVDDWLACGVSNGWSATSNRRDGCAGC